MENSHMNALTPLRSIEFADLPALLGLNNNAVPNVNALDLARLAELVGLATVALTADGENDVDCLLLALRPGSRYDSANYLWFSERGDDFLYVDRIVVSPAARSQQLGTRLYDELAGRARALGLARITCEVNLVPPNPGSQRFHHRLGFTEVGQLDSVGGKRVSLMEKVLGR